MVNRLEVHLRSQLLILLVAVAGIAVTAGAAGAVHITGTIAYAGSQGPVSAIRPILVFVYDDPLLLNFPVAKATVDTDGGSFDLDVPGTNYLGYVLDVNGDGQGSVGEPGELFNDQAGPPADPISDPQSLTLAFDDTHLVSGIAGIATYTGNKGQVSESHRIIVESFTDADLTHRAAPRLRGTVKTNGNSYQITTLDTATYYLRAFFDINGNFRFDGGEPFEIYNDKSTPPAEPVAARSDQTVINFQFGDENAFCVGDCGANEAVTVDELLTMVNIALGGLNVTECDVGDANKDERITVDEILTAVNNALSSCYAPVVP